MRGDCEYENKINYCLCHLSRRNLRALASDSIDRWELVLLLSGCVAICFRFSNLLILRKVI
jgi:hypothetical protein